MSGGSSSGGTQKIIQEPWDGAKPYMTDLYKAASGVWQGAGSTPPPSQIHAGPNQGQRDALSGVRSTAGGWQAVGDRLRSLAPQFEATSAGYRDQGRGYFGVAPQFQQQGQRYQGAAPQWETQASAYRGAQPEFNNAADFIRGLGGGMTYGTGLTRSLADDTVSGKYLTADSNPYIRGAVNAAQYDTFRNFWEQANPAIKNGALANGTYGGDRTDLIISRAMEGALAQAGRDAQGIYFQNYGQERDRMMQAPQLYGQANQLSKDAIWGTQAGLDTRLRALGLGDTALDRTREGLAIGDTGLERLMQGLGAGDMGLQRYDTATQRDMQGIETLDRANRTGLEGWQIMGQAGDQEQQWDQAALDAELQRWGINRDAAWDPLMRMLSVLTGGGYSSQTQTSSTPRSASMFQGAVGGGMNGYLLSQLMGGNPQMLSLIGSALGGASGY